MHEEKKIELAYRLYASADDLPPEWRALLKKAGEVTADAYAPYSRFSVGAAALLANGEIITGTNQENASYPVGICAERVLLANAATLHPGVAVTALAVSYVNAQGISDHPISPCGMCRQSLCEYETRTHNPMTLILGGRVGEVYVISSAAHLLPFAFSSNELAG